MLYDDLDTIAENSFRNFHAKGLDYLCLHRSPLLTIKAYFYEMGQDSVPEVVCPHDHRYPFSTHILAGESGHIRYLDMPAFAFDVPTHDRFEWRTPLLGGDGFTWVGEARIDTQHHERYSAGDSYWCRPDEIHTITITRNDTILLLYQHADTLPVDVPTSTFSRIGTGTPRTDGLYDRMPLALAEARLAVVKDRIAALTGEPA